MDLTTLKRRFKHTLSDTTGPNLSGPQWTPAFIVAEQKHSRSLIVLVVRDGDVVRSGVDDVVFRLGGPQVGNCSRHDSNAAHAVNSRQP